MYVDIMCICTCAGCLCTVMYMAVFKYLKNIISFVCLFLVGYLFIYGSFFSPFRFSFFPLVL